MQLGPIALGRGDDTNRITRGVGDIRERTIEFGSTVIAIQNIGSIAILYGKRSYLLLIIGGLAVFAGLSQLSKEPLQAMGLTAIGIALIAINLTQKIDAGLSIGTCDGLFTLIVSKDQEFLGQLLDFVRTKVDTNNLAMKGTINVDTRYINMQGGSIAIGPGAVAVGAGSNVNANT